MTTADALIFEGMKPEAWAREFYALEVQAKLLVGYVDVNFLLTTKDGEQFLLKVSSLDTIKEFLHAQNQILQFLNKKSAQPEAFPRVLASEDQLLMRTVKVSGQPRFLRLLTYLKGDFLHQVAHTPAMMWDFGRFLGSMNTCLSDLKIPSLGGKRSIWDLQYALDSVSFCSDINDTHYRRLVEYFMQQYQYQVVPQYQELPRGVIHGDGNDHNVLVSNHKICGLIDFGDCCYSHIIHELAIALTYVMMGTKEPFTVARQVVAGYHSERPLAPLELELLYYLITARLSVSLCISSHHLAEDPTNEYIGWHQTPVKELMDTLLAINPVQFERNLKEYCQMPTRKCVSVPEMLTRRQMHISKTLSVSYREPLNIIRGAMQYLYGADGKTYLDGVNNICHVGHCHPRIVSAASRQWAQLNTNTRYLYAQLNEYASQICALLPDPLSVVFFVNSGSEANDLALRMARTYTGRQDVMVLEGAYHGNSTATIEISPYKYRSPGGPGKQNFIHEAPMPDPYRGSLSQGNSQDLSGYLGFQSRLLDDIVNERGGIAAFIAESLPGCGGQIVFPASYLKETYQQVRQYGAVCIADEVQVGFGRVGSHFWGFQTQGVIPDIVTMGKPMGNGHPLAAVVTTEEIARAFDTGMEYFNSFGGNPVSCEIGKAVLQVIEEEELQAHAFTLGSKIMQGLEMLKDKYDVIGDVRGQGLFLGIEFVENRDTKVPEASFASAVVEQMKERGVLLSVDGPFHNVIKFKPPMVFNGRNAEYLIDNLGEVILHSLSHKA